MKLRPIDWLTIVVTVIILGATVYVYFTIEDRGTKAIEQAEELVILLKQ
jgi:hypothetical protein